MSLFHPSYPRTAPVVQAEKPSRGLRRNVHDNPLTFLGASLGLLAVVGVKILFSRQRIAPLEKR